MRNSKQQLAQEREKYEARARYIRALAHPARLFIVDELAESERCVNDLHILIGGDRTTLSKHLAVLRDAGVVLTEKRGAQVYYRLRTPCILEFFGCIEQALRQVATEQLEAAGGRRK